MHDERKEPKSRTDAKEFVRAPGNKNFTFTYRGVKVDAERHVHNMRVQLSKMRAIIRRRGGAVKPFKMNLIDIKESHDEKGRISCKITLSKKAPSQEIIDGVSEVLDEMTMGQQVDTGRK